MKIDIGFVILSYMAVLDTIECIESVEANIDTEDYVIVIVDNKSPDQSVSVLKEKIKNKYQHIILIENSENLGFARANNIGMQFIRNHYECEYIVVCNNDIILLENAIYKKLKRCERETGFGVLGPMVLTADDRWTSSPVLRNLDTIEQIQKIYIFDYILYVMEKVYISKLFLRLYSVFVKIRKCVSRKKIYEVGNKSGYPVRKENVILHGCFFVFSSRFFERKKGFNEQTFLYHEEEILFLECLHEQIKTVFAPEIVIYHKEDCSTNASLKGQSDHKKLLKKYRVQLDSCKILKEAYKELKRAGE